MFIFLKNNQKSLMSGLNFGKELCLKDDFPVLDVLILPVTHDSRQNSIDFFQHLFNTEGVPLVN